jgi:diaminopimelate epimerase
VTAECDTGKRWSKEIHNPQKGEAFMNSNNLPGIHFFKMTGAGNDFIVIDNRNGVIDADHCREFVLHACRRKLSVGADGVILIENDPDVDFKWRFFNADASEAEMCGNGARCAARFARLRGIVQNDRMRFRAIAGIVEAELLGKRVKVQMTPPYGLKLGWNVEAENRHFQLDFINSGVPHAICYLENENELELADVQRWGRALRYHPEFQPAGTNADFILVRDRQRIAVRTYERGVEGETLACGTGCIASTLVAAARGHVVSPVEVETRSGEFLIVYFEWDGNGFSRVQLEGEAKIAYEADLWPETI